MVPESLSGAKRKVLPWLLRSLPNLPQEKRPETTGGDGAEKEDCALTTLKDRRVNIRLSSGDLSDIQVKALEEGIIPNTHCQRAAQVRVGPSDRAPSNQQACSQDWDVEGWELTGGSRP
jgi:hypothetical protein